jgi:deoxyribodipyrimidine photo-lyase
MDGGLRYRRRAVLPGLQPDLAGKKFDPSGDYVRRYVRELRDVPTGSIHELGKLAGGPPNGYPAPTVDHTEERRESLRRLAQIHG